ncbi:MAG TPA: respiratory nitrate reductase subunit gamma [Solirubrobacterales bacterium]|nr:respiratory nitrate reductase subunit gamma [Solirubrobacterales bacterium]
MSAGSILLYAVLPYAAIAAFLVGMWWRYRNDQYGWGARSTQLLESRTLKYASTAFHIGVLAAIGGHVLGILVPRSWTAAVGINDEAYHVIAVIGGLGAGAAVCVGFALLVYRRIRFPRVRVTTTRIDMVAFALLAIGIVTGMLATITNFGDAVHYRETVGPWFRNLLIFNPEPELMTGAHVTFIFQLHVTAVWFLYAFWPFSRLVHAFSVPVDYLRRSPILYRSRTPRSHRPHGAGAGAAARLGAGRS